MSERSATRPATSGRSPSPRAVGPSGPTATSFVSPKLPRSIRWLLLLPLLSACAGLLPRQEVHYLGSFSPVCSPVDALGYQLDLDLQDGPGAAQLTLVLWQPNLLDGGGAIGLRGTADTGTLTVCPANGVCRPLPSARLRLESAGPSGLIRGQLIWSSAGTRHHAHFEAHPDPSAPELVCG